MSVGKEAAASELRVVMLGPVQKHQFFKNLCLAADKYEKHVHYNDVHYMHLKKGENDEEVLEVSDPGMAHTGNREMAIRNCDIALIYCSATTATSFAQLQSLIPDFEARKSVPVRFFFDTDDVAIEDEDGSSTGISSVSEGYESDPESPERMRRRNSMEKIRRLNEDGVVTIEQVNELSEKFGSDVRVDQIASSQMDNTRELLEVIAEDAIKNKKKTVSKRRLLSLGGSKSRENSKSRHNSSESKEEDKKIEKQGSKKERKNSQKDSKVCSIM
ncbi:unnamed protein product, partial [Mesorhabditis spiculigera]